MHSLLIVDDEPIIVEGLYDCFQQLGDLPLEVYKAFNAKEALSIARRARIDVLLTDIEMPGMNGLELQEAMNTLWPRCKTVFLTGYNDFEYIQASMRKGASDYVLKREEDSTIIESVRKAVQAINLDHSQEGFMQLARHQWTHALPVLRKEYLLELLQGECSTPESRSARFGELSIPLQSDNDVYLCVGRIDEWREDSRPGDKSLLMYGIDNIVKEHFSESFETVFMSYGHDRFLWIMQPMTEGEDRFGGAPYIMGTIESIQTACKTYLKLPCSFIAGNEPCRWERLSSKFDRLNFQFVRGLGLGNEILLTDGQRFSAEMHESRVNEKEISLLSQALERQDSAAFFRRFDELSGSVQVRKDIKSGATLTMFYSFSSMFIFLLNRQGLWEEIGTKANLNKLLSIQEHASWEDAVHYFRMLAQTLFDRAGIESLTETNDLVWRINTYIKDHLGGDLSLGRLSELVHLTPFYLSRLYKQQTGQSLTDYIMEMKVVKAKELLIGSTKKIYQIGMELGFQSAPYFNRLFKRMTNMTPQEYRDAHQRTEI